MPWSPAPSATRSIRGASPLVDQVTQVADHGRTVFVVVVRRSHSTDIADIDRLEALDHRDALLGEAQSGVSVDTGGRTQRVVFRGHIQGHGIPAASQSRRQVAFKDLSIEIRCDEHDLPRRPGRGPRGVLVGQRNPDQTRAAADAGAALSPEDAAWVMETYAELRA